MADDSFISLRYSQRLLQGHGLTWNDGERVEGYSNLTWVLACALLGLFGIDLVLAARLVAALATASTFAAIVYAFHPRRDAFALSGVVAVLGFALSTPIAVWAVGGLEQPLVAATAAWALALSLYSPEPRKRWPTCVLLAALALSRPDGVMVAGLITGGTLLGRGLKRVHLQEFALTFGSAVGAALIQLTFRVWYYGDWVPNPARIKLALTVERLELGLHYLMQAAFALAPSALAFISAVVLLAFQRRMRARLLPIVFLGLGWASYVAFIGGDIFPGRRHIVLLVVAGAFAVGEVFTWLHTRVSSRGRWVLAAAYGLTLATLQFGDAAAARARRERWEWDGKAIGSLLKRAFHQAQPLMAVDPAGCLPFFSQLPSIDMLGLNDWHIARHPPPRFGRGPLAHDFGDGKYVLKRKPDLVLWCLPHGSERPCFRSGVEMAADPEFRQKYRLVTFEVTRTRSFQSRIWVRTESPKIGLRRVSNDLDIPGYLFAQGRAVARWKGETLVTVATARKPGFLKRLRLDAGSYGLKINASDAVNVAARNAVPKRKGDTWQLDVPVTTHVNLSIAPAGTRSVDIRRVQLHKLP
jgi:arabinofuranosyltransferase